MQRLQLCAKEMVCDADQPVPLGLDVVEQALELEGECGCILANYEELQREFEEQKLRSKVSEALSVLLCFEDDGNMFGSIEESVKYFREIVDENQNFMFGVKRVQKVSPYPVKILFSGILPINQIHMHIGTKVKSFIESDAVYFSNRFAALRQEISKSVGIPILPVVPVVDEQIGEYDVVLKDPLTQDTIASFTLQYPLTKESLEPYLKKLSNIYKVLAEQKCYNRIL